MRTKTFRHFATAVAAVAVSVPAVALVASAAGSGDNTTIDSPVDRARPDRDGRQRHGNDSKSCWTKL